MSTELAVFGIGTLFGVVVGFLVKDWMQLDHDRLIRDQITQEQTKAFAKQIVDDAFPKQNYRG